MNYRLQSVPCMFCSNDINSYSICGGKGLFKIEIETGKESLTKNHTCWIGKQYQGRIKKK